jgi:glycosyltransferase involved in cell wall biosynthesis
MSSSLLEAMSCGLPVIATLVGGNADLVDSNLEAGKTVESHYHIGKNGVLVSPEDIEGLSEAIVKLLKDEELSNRLGRNARKLVENRFSQESIVNAYVNLYCNLQ